MNINISCKKRSDSYLINCNEAFKIKLTFLITTKYAAMTDTLFHCPEDDDIQKRHGECQGVILKCFTFL